MAIRVGVMGVGFMGKTHMGIYSKNSRSKLTGYFDFDPRKQAGDWGGPTGNIKTEELGFDPKALKAYKTPDELFADPEIDLVDICLPTNLHAEFAIKALAGGKHVLCEKPFTVDLKDADKIVAASKKAKGSMMVAHCMRFWPGWNWLKVIAKEKSYGKIQSATFKRYASTPGYSANSWLLNPKLSGAALFDLHVHDADFVRFLFGDPQAVFSVASGGKATKGVDHVVTSYLFKNKNLLVTAEGGWNADSTYPFTMRYTVVFDKATADFDMSRGDKALQLHVAGAKEAETIPLKPCTGWEQEIDYFLQCIEEKKKPVLSMPADARETVKLLNAELKSIQTRKIVKF